LGARALTEFDHGIYEPSSHIYPHPFQEDTLKYVIGRRPATAIIGQHPIAGTDHTVNLDGNFGVMYNLEVVASNPTDQTAAIEIVFEASAGYTGGLFYLDGEFTRTPLLGPKQQSRLTVITLAPHATVRKHLTTFPVSGGSYPAAIIVRPKPTAN
jgi:hypothetical protein